MFRRLTTEIAPPIALRTTGRDDDGAELVGTLVFRHALANLQRCQNFLMQKNTKSCISVERQFQQVHAIFISTVEAIENNKQTWHRQPRL